MTNPVDQNVGGRFLAQFMATAKTAKAKGAQKWIAEFLDLEAFAGVPMGVARIEPKKRDFQILENGSTEGVRALIFPLRLDGSIGMPVDDLLAIAPEQNVASLFEGSSATVGIDLDFYDEATGSTNGDRIRQYYFSPLSWLTSWIKFRHKFENWRGDFIACLKSYPEASARFGQHGELVVNKEKLDLDLRSGLYGIDEVRVMDSVDHAEWLSKTMKAVNKNKFPKIKISKGAK